MRASYLNPFIILFVPSLFLSFSAESKTFKSKFIRMELPRNWDCSLEELDYVCQPEKIAERSEAIVMIVTKPVDPVDDNLGKYTEILSREKKMRDLVGNSYVSQVKYVRNKEIRNHTWVDSLQLGSEIPGFYSRYIASTKDKVAGLIAYHVSESVYSKWAEVLSQMIESAEIHFDPKAFDAIMKNKKSSLFPKVSSSGSRFHPNVEAQKELAQKEEEGDLSKYAGIAFLLICIGAYIYKKKKG